MRWARSSNTIIKHVDNQGYYSATGYDVLYKTDEGTGGRVGNIFNKFEVLDLACMS